jgi:dephospho-CoA kinase
MVYGLTGGIATGKSFVCDCFAAYGARVVSADDWARAAVAPGSDGLRQVAERFGESYLTADGGLDRGRLAAHVFAHPQERATLEAILHPTSATSAAGRSTLRRRRSPTGW